ncbi:ribosomal subunit 39S-domain-containing protein [Apiospora arundinis]
MRRIARLRKPSGAPLASIARPLCTQRAAPRPSPSPAVKTNTLRFYSSRQPEVLPASLTGRKSGVPEGFEEAVEGAEVQEYEIDPSQQRVFVPPPRPSVAERADTITDTLYTPATSAEGLESIGNLGNWWDDQAHWPETSDFVGFKPKQKVEEPVLIEAAVRRALTETLVVKQLGKDDQLTAHWGLQDKAQHDAVLALDVRVDSNGNATVTGDLHSVADGLAEDGVEHGFTLPSAAEALAWKGQSDHSWKGASLQDARVKFAVIKRVMQLTGHAVPDHKLADIATARGLLATLQKPPKPKTLSQEIETKKQDLVGLPNVAFSPKRVTRGHKDQALGRFKLIEAEFKKRDLQDGPLAVPKSREMKHWKGEA